MKTDWEQAPRKRVFEFVQVSSTITAPVVDACFKGQITVEDAAVQVAPFFLIWGGFGFDPPADADPDWFERREQFVQAIFDLGGPA